MAAVGAAMLLSMRGLSGPIAGSGCLHGLALREDGQLLCRSTPDRSGGHLTRPMIEGWPVNGR